MSTPALDMTSDEAAVREAIGDRAPITFVIGRAGTGKTRLLRAVAGEASRRAAIVAPTGLAALTAGGQTIHSFFGIPPYAAGPNRDFKRLRRRVLRTIDLLLIDEVSMVRADLLDSIDLAMREARGVNAPFGDAPVAAFGDFLQLPPVVTSADAEVLSQLDYRSPYAFDAQVMRDIDPVFVEMTIVHRQEDETFINLLGRLRAGDPDAVTEINERCHRRHREGAMPVMLASTNRLADAYNERGMNGLPGEPAVFEGALSEKFQRDRLPAAQMLALKVRARVMAVRNDPSGRFVNGSLGTVRAIDGDEVSVLFDGAKEAVTVEPATWESVRYDLDGDTLTTSIVGSYKQIPLALAWAITIHKSQGLTLEDVRIDLGRGAFASGQAYVALSRCRTLEGLSLARPLTPRDLLLDPALERFV
ncbi:MAG: DEAD/DEAH box helicase [Caulobacterales bacterium]|nr:DEAD/DEAH box helicase [Caulobacterales bacterium]